MFEWTSLQLEQTNLSSVALCTRLHCFVQVRRFRSRSRSCRQIAIVGAKTVCFAYGRQQQPLIIACTYSDMCITVSVCSPPTPRAEERHSPSAERKKQTNSALKDLSFCVCDCCAFTAQGMRSGPLSVGVYSSPDYLFASSLNSNTVNGVRCMLNAEHILYSWFI